MAYFHMMKTEYPSRKFIEEYEANFPDEGKVKELHITTDGTTLSQDEIDDLARQLIESRKSGKCRTMTAGEINALSSTHETKPVKEFLASLDKQDD